MRIFVKSFIVESVNVAGIKAAKNGKKIAVSKLLNVY